MRAQSDTFVRLWLFALTATVFALGSTTPASACLGGGQRVEYFSPACYVPAANLDDEMIVISYDEHDDTSPLFLDEQQNYPSTGLIDVEIKNTGMPLYIVLTHTYPMIWRFSGEVDAISRVIALGSTRWDPRLVGVAGVPKEKISFPQPDAKVFAQGQFDKGKALISSCGGSAAACVPHNFFFRYPVSNTDRTAVLKTKIKGAPWYGATLSFPGFLPGLQPVDAGTVNPAYFDRPRHISAETSDPTGPVQIRNNAAAVYPESDNFKPRDVISPVSVRYRVHYKNWLR